MDLIGCRVKRKRKRGRLPVDAVDDGADARLGLIGQEARQQIAHPHVADARTAPLGRLEGLAQLVDRARAVAVAAVPLRQLNPKTEEPSVKHRRHDSAATEHKKKLGTSFSSGPISECSTEDDAVLLDRWWWWWWWWPCDALLASASSPTPPPLLLLLFLRRERRASVRDLRDKK